MKGKDKASISEEKKMSHYKCVLMTTSSAGQGAGHLEGKVRHRPVLKEIRV